MVNLYNNGDNTFTADLKIFEENQANNGNRSIYEPMEIWETDIPHKLIGNAEATIKKVVTNGKTSYFLFYLDADLACFTYNNSTRHIPALTN